MLTVADPIINKLIEKGIIESYEAQEIRNEISNVVKKQLDEEKRKKRIRKKKMTKNLKYQVIYKFCIKMTKKLLLTH